MTVNVTVNVSDSVTRVYDIDSKCVGCSSMAHVGGAGGGEQSSTERSSGLMVGMLKTLK